MPVRFRPSAQHIQLKHLHTSLIPAPVAQWIARLPPKEQVAGSIPARGGLGFGVFKT